MNVYFETAYAAASGRLCLFVGTGFSKAITAGAAHSWQELLESVCEELREPNVIKDMLFPTTGGALLAMDVRAQVIAIELAKDGKDIHEEIAKRVRSVALAGDNTRIREFLNGNSVDVVTTNYDKLMEELAGIARCHSIAPGFPVPRSRREVNVYHLHGSTDSPGNIVATSEDYFQFMNRESYFSKKLLTLLHENTVIVLGYSLGDASLNAILSDYRQIARGYVSVGNLFFVSRERVAQQIKDYYAHCYGIRVVDETEIRAFFQRVLEALPNARARHKLTVENIAEVLSGSAFYSDDYLALETSFYEIIAAIAAVGRSVVDPAVLRVLQSVLDKKTEFTSRTGAWEQYDHLARWLLYIGSRIDMKNTDLEQTYLRACLQSMENMSNQLRLGYSWSAYKSWNAGWAQLTPDNRVLTREYIRQHTGWDDALRVVSSD